LSFVEVDLVKSQTERYLLEMKCT